VIPRVLLLIALFLGLVAGAARANPPRTLAYWRYDALLDILADRYRELKRQEEFEAKPLVAKMLIRYEQGYDTLGKIRLTGDGIVRAVEEWKELDKAPEQLSQDARDVLSLLPLALQKHFRRGGSINKRERYKVSKRLVRWLTHERFHMRQAGIDSLDALYRTRRSYDPASPPAARAAKQKEWEHYIKRERSR